MAISAAVEDGFVKRDLYVGPATLAKNASNECKSYEIRKFKAPHKNGTSPTTYLIMKREGKPGDNEAHSVPP